MQAKDSNRLFCRRVGWVEDELKVRHRVDVGHDLGAIERCDGLPIAKHDPPRRVQKAATGLELNPKRRDQSKRQK